MIGGQSAVAKDIPPYVSASGNRARLYGLNTVGLRRGGFSAETIGSLKTAYKIIFRSGLGLEQALQKVMNELPKSQEIIHLTEFVSETKRGVTR